MKCPTVNLEYRQINGVWKIEHYWPATQRSWSSVTCKTIGKSLGRNRICMQSIDLEGRKSWRNRCNIQCTELVGVQARLNVNDVQLLTNYVRLISVNFNITSVDMTVPLSIWETCRPIRSFAILFVISLKFAHFTRNVILNMNVNMNNQCDWLSRIRHAPYGRRHVVPSAVSWAGVYASLAFLAPTSRLFTDIGRGS